MKTAISIPDDLFEAAEKAGGRLGLSRSELYQRALAAFLELHDRAEVTEALDRVYFETPEKPPVDPVLERLQWASLPEESW